MEQPATGVDPPTDNLRATGERIDALIEASSAGGVVARERAEELVRLVADLYGAGLERILDILYDMGRLDDDAVAALADDDLVSGLLLVHGLHPYDVTTRVENALESVRPYLGTHGGDVKLLEVTPDGIARLQLLGSCDGCPSSSVTLSLAVEGAVEAAAPEIESIEVQTGDSGTAGANSLIPVESLRARLQPAEPSNAGDWESAPRLADLRHGELAEFVLSDVHVLACRIQDDLFAFQDECPHCMSSLSGSTIERRLGYPTGDAVLRCPSCRSHYDVRRAGAGLDHEADHLTPLPVLVRDGVVRVAVPSVTS